MLHHATEHVEGKHKDDDLKSKSEILNAGDIISYLREYDVKTYQEIQKFRNGKRY